MPEILDYLLAENFTLYMETQYKGNLGKEYPVVSFLPLSEGITQSQFLLVIGGDGTILRVAGLAALLGKPVVGLNMGMIGFLTELEFPTLELLRNIKDEKYNLDRRILIDVKVIEPNNDVAFSAQGLNDAIIMKSDISKTARVAVNVNGSRVMAFSGDGVIVCTPTGSTAYSLSAGGPIIEPTSSCFAVTPVCPHSLGIKSFVVSSDRIIEIIAPSQANSLTLSVDGYQNRHLVPGERVLIEQCKKELSLFRLKGTGFYERINQKLSNEQF